MRSSYAALTGLIRFRRGTPRKRAEALRLGRVVLGRVDPADPVEVTGRVFRDFPGEGDADVSDISSQCVLLRKTVAEKLGCDPSEVQLEIMVRPSEGGPRIAT